MFCPEKKQAQNNEEGGEKVWRFSPFFQSCDGFFPSNRKKRALTSSCDCLNISKADQQEESQKARFASRAPIKVLLDQNCIL